MVQLQAAHVRAAMHAAGPPLSAGCSSTGAGAADGRCCSNHQLAAAWAWFERGGAGSSSPDAALRRADILGDAVRRRTAAARRPSRFKEEFLSSHHQLHPSQDFQSARRWRHSFDSASRRMRSSNCERGDVAARCTLGRLSTMPAAADHRQQQYIRDDHHRASTDLSRLVDEYEIESLCRQLRRHIKGAAAHPALHSTANQPSSKYGAADEEGAMVSASFCPNQALLSPDMQKSMRKSHSTFDFLPHLPRFHLISNKPRRHLPLLCSSRGGTIDSLRTTSHGSSSVTLIRNKSTKAKYSSTLDSDSIAQAGAVIGTQNASAEELDSHLLHKHRHVHHHHHHHHHHVLHHSADETLLRLERTCTLAVDRDGRKDAAPSLLSPKGSNLENQKIHLQLREILAGQRSYYNDERNEELPDNSKYCYGDNKKRRDDQRFNSITNTRVSAHDGPN